MRDGADGVEAGPAPERRVRESMRRQELRARRGRRPRRAYNTCAGEVGDGPANVRAEGFFGTIKQESPYSREWAGVTRDEFCAQLDDYMRWYVRGRPKGFRQGGRTRYEAPAARRRRLGVAVPPERCGIVA